MIATLIRGVESVEHLEAGADVVAGQMVEVGNAVLIAKADAKANTLAAFAVGGGVYRVTETTAGGPSAGSPAYLDASGKLKGDDGKHIGLCLSVTGDDCVIRHMPDGSVLAK